MGKVLALCGSPEGHKHNIAKEILARIPLRSKMITSVTTASEKDTDIPGEFENVATQSDFYRQKKDGGILAPGWYGANLIGIKKDSVTAVLQTQDQFGLVILEDNILRPLLLAPLQDFLSPDYLLSESLIVFYIVPPRQEDSERRADDQRAIERFVRGSRVVVHFLYSGVKPPEEIADEVLKHLKL